MNLVFIQRRIAFSQTNEMIQCCEFIRTRSGELSVVTVVFHVALTVFFVGTECIGFCFFHGKRLHTK